MFSFWPALGPVIAGLDPAIHPLRKKVLSKRMDPRVKPAGDAGEGLR
jgi:peptide/nickel transport system ATP-binding protein